MTHEQLVEAINSPTYRNSRNCEHPYQVIGAILELHAPVYELLQDEFGVSFDSYWCKSCEYTEYPCLTIEVLRAKLR